MAALTLLQIAMQHLTHVDGVMLGRAANHNSALLTHSRPTVLWQQPCPCAQRRHEAALNDYFSLHATPSMNKAPHCTT